MSIDATKSFILTKDFLGYQSRKDITNLPAGVLISGSQNVITKTNGRVGIVKGYTLDGQDGTTISAGIESSYDTDMNYGEERHLRSYTDPTTGNGVVQFRYVDSAGAVTWETLSSSLDRGLIRYTKFFDFTTEKNDLILMVDNTANVYEWTGAITTVASVTTNTITKEGVKYWSEMGFNGTNNRKIMIRGVEYTYTGGQGTLTLTGVTPDPTAQGANVPIAGDMTFQSLTTVPNSSITTLPDTLPNSYIATFKNQVYYASEVENDVYISKLNNYKDCSVSTVRVVGEGGLLHLDANITGFVPQEDAMYISAGKDQWYNTKFALSSDNAKEALDIDRLKTTSRQAAYSQEFITKDKNNVIFVSNEPVLTTLGRVSGVISTPQSSDISWTIIDDFNSYNFTGGSCKYHKNFIYVSVPSEGLIRIYNQTKADNQYWEAPITYPVGMFSVIDGELYGHSFSNPETYKLFDGGSFDGSSYNAVAVLSYQNYGDRAALKGFNQFYTEGYISANTTLNLGIIYEIDGCASTIEYPLLGNSAFVCKYKSDAPLGKVPLGINPLGGSKNAIPALPPKFRWAKTFVPNYFYEHCTYYKSTGVDMNWEILAYGPRLIHGKDISLNIQD